MGLGSPLSRPLPRPLARPLTAGGVGGGVNLLLNGAFNSDSVWTKGGGWSIGGGKASRTNTGSASNLSQAVAFVEGASYQLTYTVTDLSSGSITPRFIGGTTVSGITRSAPGTYTETLVALAGNATFAFLGSSSFAGGVDNARMVRLSNPPALLTVEGLPILTVESSPIYSV